MKQRTKGLMFFSVFFCFFFPVMKPRTKGSQFHFQIIQIAKDIGFTILFSDMKLRLYKGFTVNNQI